MGLVLALAAAVTYGSADFLGGLASRRASTLLVTLVAQSAGLAVVLPIALVLRTPADPASLAWGAASGVFGCIGIVAFFRALASGAMSAAAPVTAVVGAALPVVAGLLLGERPGFGAWAGIAAGLVAVATISWGGERSGGAGRGSLGLAVVAGVGFGLFFTALSRAAPTSGLWPLFAGRIGSLSLLAVVLLAGRMPVWRAKPAALGMAVVSGTVDMTANVFFLLATRQGELALVAVLTSLYPAATVLLALVVLRERLRRSQLAGVALALLAVALIASG